MGAKRPNFLVIVADDMGYSDLGCFGSEIETPWLDKLAREGLMFTDFHTAATCSPTRAMLFSGTDSHLSGLGAMAEGRGGAVHAWYQPGYEGYLNFDVAALPEILSDAGYYNVLAGKWHLGFKPECDPHSRGFHRTLALLPGQTNHFAFHPELEEFSLFLARMPILHTENGRRKIIPTNTASRYETGFYSTDHYTDTLIRFLEERDSTNKTKPFFAALPFAAPHWPLQCSREDRQKYKGQYDDGPTALRERRVARMKELGVIDKKAVPHPVINEIMGGKSYVQWEQMNDEQREKSARAMETYAGMITSIDRNVGKVLEYLEKIGVADNTFVCFFSDNGAEGAALEARDTVGDELLKVAHKYYDNKLDNIGNFNSFVWYGPRWAQASTAPGKLYKGYSTEGGIRVPFILKYPSAYPPGSKVRAFSTVMDLAPTILDLAGVSHPVPRGEPSGTYRGRKVYGLRGKSWSTALKRGLVPDDTQAIYGAEDFFGWELGGRAALRKDGWKITYLPKNNFGKDKFELYDMIDDPGETKDVAEDQPERYQDMLKAWSQYVQECNTFWPPGEARQKSNLQPRADKRAPEDSIGGDPIEQCTAWMDVGEGEVARPTLPRYDHILGLAA